MTKKIKYGLFISGAILLLIIILVIEIPYSYSIQGKILAGRDWFLIRQTDGSLMEITRDNIKGVIQHYGAYQIDRGDMVQFQINPAALNQDRVSQSDTLGIFSSSFLAEDLSRLQGELDLAQATLEVSRTGEKQSLLTEAEKTYMLNLERARVQQRILEREATLFSDNLVSNQDYEITRGMTRIYELEAQVAEARLRSLKTGAKPEEINLVRVQIESIQRNLEILRKRINWSYLKAPIQGTLTTEMANDTLFIVNNAKRVVIMPVPYEYYGDITLGQVVSGKLPNNEQKLTGKVIRIENEIRILGGQQIFLVTAILDIDERMIPVNLITLFDIATLPKTGWHHLRTLVENLFF